MFSDGLSWIHFWGWQSIILAAAITLPLGITTSKEYAELEWPIDIAITIIWVVFGMEHDWHDHQTPGAAYVRRYLVLHRHICYGSGIAPGNSFEIPVPFKSYSWYAGVQDALVQWWYGHNAVAFFLTTPFLGIMYYFLPKAANRPVYSYRLSIIHFWSLIFIYIWAGPHHLLYTSLAGLGAVAGRCIFHHAHCSVVGRYAERLDDAQGRLGPCPGRSGFKIHGRGSNRLWYGNTGGPLALT